MQKMAHLKLKIVPFLRTLSIDERLDETQRNARILAIILSFNLNTKID
jgi:hypothetical protein